MTGFPSALKHVIHIGQKCCSVSPLNTNTSWRNLTALVAAVLISQPTAAAVNNNLNTVSAELKQQRQLYQQAQTALKKGQSTQFTQIASQLTDYPLYPYLRYEQLRRNLSGLSQAEFDEFAGDFADTPLPRRLQIRWIRYLAKRQQWPLFLANFPEHTSSASLNCQRGIAQLKTGDTPAAMKSAETLWLVGKSQPSVCDPLFSAWIKQGGATEAMAWERFWLAILNSQTSLANYLTRFLTSAEKKQQAAYLISLSRNPSLLDKNGINRQWLDLRNKEHSEFVALLIKRLIRKDPEMSVRLWNQYQQDLHLTNAQQQSLIRRLGTYVLKSYHPNSNLMLATLDPGFSDEKLLEWRLRYQLSRQDWEAIGFLIEKLPADILQKDRWQYWSARWLHAKGDSTSAVATLEKLADKRNFYGFLAAQKLGKHYQLNHTPMTTNAEMLNQLAALPALQRARELHYHGENINARSEWWRATRSFSKEQHYHAGLLAQGWGWISQGITGAINARHWDDLSLRFPAPYQQKVTAKANQFNIDDQWVYAIARQESAFRADVRSPAGAVGLMQLMPRTAKQTAQSIKLPYKGSYQLVNPETNITLGSAYLSQMYQRHQQNRIYATAAYNAGPYRVKQWLNERGDLPIDIWVETIPFDETRQYVQNVMSYVVIYSDKLGKPMEFLTELERKSLVTISP